jgi:glycosyltransferase involved in cell wall biosynthesis
MSDAVVNSKIRIAHASTVDLGILFLMPQLRALRDDGFEVHIMCADGSLLSSFEAEGFRVHRLPVVREMSPAADLKLLAHLTSLLRRERYTVFHAHTPKMELFGQLAARLARVPVVLYTNHGFIFRGRMNPLRRSLLKNLARFSGLISDHTLSQSAEDIEAATRQRIYRRGRLSYLGNGIDIRHLDPGRFTPERVRAKRRELGIPDENRVVGMVGRYVWEKGYSELFEAARIICATNPRVTFLTVGSALASERDPVDFSVLGKRGLADRFVVLKDRRDMNELYAVMDVVVLPSHREGFPRTLMEASAMSKPTVATDISGCREAVVDGLNGLLVPLGDARALAAKIELILSDTELSARLGAGGRALAEERFDERRVIERLKSCYADLFRRRLPGEAFAGVQSSATRQSL